MRKFGLALGLVAIGTGSIPALAAERVIRAISLGQPVGGVIDKSDDAGVVGPADYYQFHLEHAQAVTLEVTSGSAKPVSILMEGKLSPTRMVAPSRFLNGTVIYDLGAGDYYVAVGHPKGASDPYTLKLLDPAVTPPVAAVASRSKPSVATTTMSASTVPVTFGYLDQLADKLWVEGHTKEIWSIRRKANTLLMDCFTPYDQTLHRFEVYKSPASYVVTNPDLPNAKYRYVDHGSWAEFRSLSGRVPSFVFTYLQFEQAHEIGFVKFTGESTWQWIQNYRMQETSPDNIASYRSAFDQWRAYTADVNRQLEESRRQSRAEESRALASAIVSGFSQGLANAVTEQSSPDSYYSSPGSGSGSSDQLGGGMGSERRSAAAQAPGGTSGRAVSASTQGGSLRGSLTVSAAPRTALTDEELAEMRRQDAAEQASREAYKKAAAAEQEAKYKAALERQRQEWAKRGSKQ